MPSINIRFIWRKMYSSEVNQARIIFRAHHYRVLTFTSKLRILSLGLHDPAAALREEDVLRVRHTTLEETDEWQATVLDYRFVSQANILLVQDNQHLYKTSAGPRESGCAAARGFDCSGARR